MTTDRLRTSLADRYRIERELGAGGMATVYLAQDLRQERDVAIKVQRKAIPDVVEAVLRGLEKLPAARITPLKAVVAAPTT